MNENEFIIDLWDVIMGNTRAITIAEFRMKYCDLFKYVDGNAKCIVLQDENDEWNITCEKVWKGN